MKSILLYLPILLSAFCQTLKSQDIALALNRYEFSAPHMGTEFRLVFYAENDSIAGKASSEAFRRIEEMEQIFSDYREDSEVSRLSATAGKGEKVAVSNELWALLNFSQEVAKKSKGAFDVSLGALTKLWRRAFRQQEFPSAEEIKTAKNQTGYKYIQLHKGQFVELTNPGMALDLGGVAKGFAIDEAMKTLRSHGIRSALVDGGGDIYVEDPPPGEFGWKIDRMLYKNGQLATEPTVFRNAAIATSGSNYRYLEHEGKRYSHIIDPRTGMGITKQEIVTVTAQTCTEADAWATALSVEVDAKAFLWLKKQGFTIFFSLP